MATFLSKFGPSNFIKAATVAIALSVAGVSGTALANKQFEYLDTNRAKPGVIETKSGLQYRVLRKGTGKRAKADSYVEVHYKGQLIDGTEFDNSYKRGQPSSFSLGQVILGWKEGMQLMKEGAKYEFVVPYSLGYGLTGGANGVIPPKATLIFEVELRKVF